MEKSAECPSVDEAHNERAEHETRSDRDQYLLQRHGTLDLDPMPTADPADPLNWPSWKKNINLTLVAFHGLMSTGCAVAVVPAFQAFSKLFGKTLTVSSYIGSVQMVTLALGPLLWMPIANCYGRRPIWILSVLGAGLFNIACAKSNTYGEMLVFRIFSAFFISPGIAMGQAVVAETFFSHQRAQKMGIWTLAITLGPPMGPFTAGFIVQHLGWRWVYWIMAALNLGQLITYVIFSPETVYCRDESPDRQGADKSLFKRQFWSLERISPKPLAAKDFTLPLRFLADPRIILSVISYAIVFNFVLVLLTVEIPALFGVLFHLNPQQIGLNFLGLFIGCVLGEQVGGPLSDLWRNQSKRRHGGVPPAPEQRLYLTYLGFALAIAGNVIFCVTLYEAKPLHWTIKPIIGIAVSGFGSQIITTVVITYCSDCHSENSSSSIGVGINFVRCMWGFIGPFWFPYMFNSCGLRGAAGLMAAIMLISALPIAYLQWRGRNSVSRDETQWSWR